MLNLDTCILLILLRDELNERERRLIQTTPVVISAVVLWELWKLASLGKIEFDLGGVPEVEILSQFEVLPVDASVCHALQWLDFRGDPADELIAATSIVHQAPLLTRDRRLLASKVVPLA